MYAMCERKPVTATIATSTSRIEPSAAVSHGPRIGERKNPGRNGPGGAGGEESGHGSPVFSDV